MSPWFACEVTARTLLWGSTYQDVCQRHCNSALKTQGIDFIADLSSEVPARNGHAGAHALPWQRQVADSWAALADLADRRTMACPWPPATPMSDAPVHASDPELGAAYCTSGAGADLVSRARDAAHDRARPGLQHPRRQHRLPASVRHRRQSVHRAQVLPRLAPLRRALRPGRRALPDEEGVRGQRPGPCAAHPSHAARARSMSTWSCGPSWTIEREIVAYVERLATVRHASARPSGDGLVGRAPAFNAALSAVQRVAPSMLPVLLLGESGTGKELFARAVHEASPRASGPFVVVDCSGPHRDLVRERAVRLREGRVHWRPCAQARSGGDGQGRHAVPRRDGRRAACPCR